MAEMTIRLRSDPSSGKKDIIISLRSDEDMLPHEHEQQHKNLVNKLLEKGILKQGELGKAIIEREEEKTILETPPSQQIPQKEAQAQGG